MGGTVESANQRLEMYKINDIDAVNNDEKKLDLQKWMQFLLLRNLKT